MIEKASRQKRIVIIIKKDPLLDYANIASAGYAMLVEDALACDDRNETRLHEIATNHLMTETINTVTQMGESIGSLQR